MPSAWTPDLLKEYFDQRLKDLDKAVIKAETAAEKRFESVNEFRLQLGDQAANFMTRREYQASHDALTEKINDLTARVDKKEGTGEGLNKGWVILLGAIGAFTGIAALILSTIK